MALQPRLIYTGDVGYDRAPLRDPPPAPYPRDFTARPLLHTAFPQPAGPPPHTAPPAGRQANRLHDPQGFFTPASVPLPTTASAGLHHAVAQYGSMANDLSQLKICNNTARGYGTAQTAFLEFAATMGITLADLDSGDPAIIGSIGATFLCHLRATRGLQATTLDSYLGGVITMLDLAHRPHGHYLRSSSAGDRFADEQRAHPADVARHVLAHFI